MRRKLLEYIRSRGEHGATDSEAQDALGMEGSTQRPRRVELLAAGQVVDSGLRRKTASGRMAVVWMEAR